MIEKLAFRIAKYLKRVEPEKTASVEVMKFSLEALINVLITFLFVLTIGIIFGKSIESIIGLASFAFLRFFSGGIHLRTAIQCSFMSTILISISPHIPLSLFGGRIIILISLIIVILFAPSNIEDHARIPKKYFPVLKLISALIVALGFVVPNSTFIVVCFIQALTIIPFRSIYQKKEVIP